VRGMACRVGICGGRFGDFPPSRSVAEEQNEDFVAMASEGTHPQIVGPPHKRGGCRPLALVVTDVHGRALAPPVPALQDLDLLGAVGVLDSGGSAWSVRSGLAGRAVETP